MSVTCGTKLFESTPFVYCLSPNKKEILCDYCLKECSNLSRCSKCKYMHYCGSQCQRSDWAIHKHECNKFIPLQNEPYLERAFKNNFAPLFLRALLHSKLNEKSTVTDEDGLRTYEDMFDHYEDYLGNEGKMMDMTSTIMLMQSLMGNEFISKFEERELFACYGKTQTNKFIIKNKLDEPIGVALYLSASSLDHSCEPNCSVEFDGTKILIKTTRDLRPDEAPVISYCDPKLTRHQREAFLMEEYFFKCNCVKCINLENFDVELPCGARTEYKNLKYKTKDSFDCVVCKDHQINVNSCLDMPQNKLSIYKTRLEVESKKLNENKANLDEIRTKTEVALNDEYDRLKNEVDLKREKLKKQIDDYCFKLLDKIEQKRTLSLTQLDQVVAQVSGLKLDSVPSDPDGYKKNIRVVQTELENVKNLIEFSQNEVFHEFKSDIRNELKMQDLIGDVSLSEAYLVKNSQFETYRTFFGHKGPIQKAIFFGNDKVISASADFTIRVWNKQTGECIKKIETDFLKSTWCLKAYDDKHFFADSYNLIKLWNIETFECVKVFERKLAQFNGQDIVNFMGISKHGELMSGSDYGIHIWNIETTKCVQIIKGHSGSVICIEETYEDNEILSGSNDATIRLTDRKTGHKMTYDAHEETVRSLKMLNRDTFASGSTDKSVKIWNLKSGECLRTLRGHESLVTLLNLLEKNLLLTACVNGLIKIWNLENGKCLMTNRTRIGEFTDMNKSKNEIINLGLRNSVLEVWKNKILF